MEYVKLDLLSGWSTGNSHTSTALDDIKNCGNSGCGLTMGIFCDVETTRTSTIEFEYTWVYSNDVRLALLC